MESKYSKGRINLAKLRDVNRDPSLIPSAKCLLVDLLFYAGIDGNAFPSQETLAKNLGFKSSRSVRDLLGLLRKRGLVAGWKRRGYSKSNSYSFNPELYILNRGSDRKYSSSLLGTTIPLYQGNTLPPKEVIKESQLNNTNKFVENLESNTSGLKQTKELSQEQKSTRIQQIQAILSRKLGAV